MLEGRWGKVVIIITSSHELDQSDNHCHHHHHHVGVTLEQSKGQQPDPSHTHATWVLTWLDFIGAKVFMRQISI